MILHLTETNEDGDPIGQISINPVHVHSISPNGRSTIIRFVTDKVFVDGHYSDVKDQWQRMILEWHKIWVNTF